MLYAMNAISFTLPEEEPHGSVAAKVTECAGKHLHRFILLYRLLCELFACMYDDGDASIDG